ncbi:MAG: hypothetical protein ACK5F0_03760 [Flavobacteriales bacterium]|jgi:hypothetical protein
MYEPIWTLYRFSIPCGWCISRIKSPHNYTTIKDHLATTHQFMTEWNADRFLSWAESIDQNVKLLITEILNKKQHVEQSYKSCIGVLSLAKKVGNERLSKACGIALDYRIYNYKIVENILEKGLDNLIEEDDNQDDGLPNHPNIRGNNYYK